METSLLIKHTHSERGDIGKTANKERCWRKKLVYTQTAIAKEWIQYKGTGYISFLTGQSAESPWSHCIDKCIDNVFGSKSGLRMLIKVRMCRTFVLRPLVFWDLHTQIYQICSNVRSELFGGSTTIGRLKWALRNSILWKMNRRMIGVHAF